MAADIENYTVPDQVKAAAVKCRLFACLLLYLKFLLATPAGLLQSPAYGSIALYCHWKPAGPVVE